MGSQCTYPSLSGTSKEIDLQVESIERKIGKAEQTIRHFVERASHDPVAKQRALQAMKRKKQLEQQRQDLIGAQFNVDSLQDQQEQAKFTLRAVEAMRAGMDNLKRDQAKMDIKQVEDMLDQTEDMADEMRVISESLARGSDQASLESELLQLQREYGCAGVPAAAAASAPSLGEPHAAQRRLESEQTGRHDRRHVRGEDERMRGAAADALLPPPPPPFHQEQRQEQKFQQSPQQTPQQQAPGPSLLEKQKADLWAASALSAAMAPHGHLPHPGLAARKPAPRVPMAAFA